VEPSQSTSSREFLTDFVLPGDRLVAVNSLPIVSKTRDEVIAMIKASQPSVQLKVSFKRSFCLYDFWMLVLYFFM